MIDKFVKNQRKPKTSETAKKWKNGGQSTFSFSKTNKNEQKRVVEGSEGTAHSK